MQRGNNSVWFWIVANAWTRELCKSLADWIESSFTSSSPTFRDHSIDYAFNVDNDPRIDDIHWIHGMALCEWMYTFGNGVIDTLIYTEIVIIGVKNKNKVEK